MTDQASAFQVARDAAPRPWRIVHSKSPSNNGAQHLYLVDANGRKIAAIWGKTEEKEWTAELIIAALNRYEQMGG